MFLLVYFVFPRYPFDVGAIFQLSWIPRAKLLLTSSWPSFGVS